MTSGDIVLTSGEEDESSTWIKGRTVNLDGKTGKKNEEKKQVKDHKRVNDSQLYLKILFY